jgi:tetratricopeptide (TPR) repeat protein
MRRAVGIRIADLNLSNMDSWEFLKRLFQRENRKDGAENTVTHLVGVAFSLLQGANYLEARRVLLRALEYKAEIQNPVLLEWILTSLSRTWEETEEYEKWTAFFSSFVAENPNEAIGYNLRAESHWYGGSLSASITDYTRVLELNPGDASALLGRGQVFMESGDFRRAVEDLDAALDPWTACLARIPFGNPTLKHLQGTAAQLPMQDWASSAVLWKNLVSPKTFVQETLGFTLILLRRIGTIMKPKMRLRITR